MSRISRALCCWKSIVSYLGDYDLNKEDKSKKSDEFSYVAMFLSFTLAFYVKKTVEHNFTNLQELSFLMDLGFFLIIFMPLHYLFSKFFVWFYSFVEDFSSK
jgi:hypothetical protein